MPDASVSGRVGLNAVMASGGSLDAIENALTIVGLALARPDTRGREQTGDDGR
jgi:hypothetical protein